MKTRDSHKLNFIRHGLFSLAICLAGASSAAYAVQPGAAWAGVDHWQQNRLFQPTDRQRVQEEKGKVVIYDGLTDSMVERAMSSNFDRIQNMMFIRIIRTDKQGHAKQDKNGKVVVEDDDC